MCLLQKQTVNNSHLNHCSIAPSISCQVTDHVPATVQNLLQMTNILSLLTQALCRNDYRLLFILVVDTRRAPFLSGLCVNLLSITNLSLRFSVNIIFEKLIRQQTV